MIIDPLIRVFLCSAMAKRPGNHPADKPESSLLIASYGNVSIWIGGFPFADVLLADVPSVPMQTHCLGPGSIDAGLRRPGVNGRATGPQEWISTVSPDTG
ncbi:hypothetical protein [Bosea sp. LC85]|uniref:hypothetical protein n=1 Tax=Bosea sp. LC85 TaxID=1502851 RepID=UPI001269FE80|nr:hypothetical protein [Bosea sp. LC85]